MLDSRELPSTSLTAFTQWLPPAELDAKLIMNHAIPGANAGYLSRSTLWTHLLALQEKVSSFIMQHCI